MMNHDSKVSCIMVTQRSRLALARRAIEAFQAQTYPNRELVVVSEDMSYHDHQKPLPPGSLFIELPSFRPSIVGDLNQGVCERNWNWTVGEMRNIAVSRASGDFIATWDDDDLHHPERLAQQMDALLTSNKPLCGLLQMTVAWPLRNRYGITMASNKTGWEPTFITRRNRLGIYPAQNRGEALLTSVMLDVFLLKAPELYTYVIHGANTHDETHFETLWSFAMEKRFDPDSEESRNLASRVKI